MVQEPSSAELLNHAGFWSQDVHMSFTDSPKHRRHKDRSAKTFFRKTFTRSFILAQDTFRCFTVDRLQISNLFRHRKDQPLPAPPVNFGNACG